MNLLLERRPKCCDWDHCQDSALEAASFRGDLEIVLLLLQSKFYKGIMERGRDAVKAALSAGHETIVQFLINETPSLPCPKMACGVE